MSTPAYSSHSGGATEQFPSASMPTVAEVRMDRLRRNLHYIRRLAAPADVMAVVKANGYGHGVEHVVPVLEDEGVEHFAVATVAEGIRLREMDVEGEILVMGAPMPELLTAYETYDLAVALSSTEELDRIEAAARSGASFTVHLNVDTGMGRLGVRIEEAREAAGRLDRLSGTRLRAVWTHFATADQPDSPIVREQWSRFKQLVRDLGEDGRRPSIHAANSGALLYHRNTLDMPCALVRIGLALYGYAPGLDTDEPAGDSLQPVMDVSTRVVHIRTIDPGTPISYTHSWKAECRTRIATLAVGYGDGYRRALSNRAQVRIHESMYPVVGNVCMDMTMIDLGKPGATPDRPPVTVGDRALLFGAHGPTARDIARWSDTIPYEILCGISQRVPRYRRDRD